MTASKRPTRFLPTLTEVVHPIPSIVNEVGQVQDVDFEKLVEQLLASLQSQLSDTISQVIEEHMVSLELRIHSELESVVRSALTQARSQDGSSFL